MIQNNQDLIKTIKRILEVFPEAIIIQSFDKDTSKLVLQFTNQAAKKEVIDYPDSSGKPIDEQHLNYVIKTYDDVKDKTHSEFNDDQSESYSLTELLHIHAYSVQTNGAESILNTVLSSVEFCSKNYTSQSEIEEENSKRRFFNVKTLCVKWDNNENSFIHVFINTTAVKRFEMEKSRNEVLQLMFSSVSHEFRTPINAFSNSMQLIESSYNMFLDKLRKSKFFEERDEVFTKQSEETNNKLFKICKISTTSLLSLVEDILDLAKIEAGTFTINEQPFDIRTLANEIKYIFEFQWVQKGLQFRVDASEELLDTKFCSDIGRIKQVLINLISNAYKFTFEGRIILQISLENQFSHSSFERSRYLKFKVHDTGIGIEAKEIPKLFRLFGTISQNKNNINSRGTGLGLAISKKIVESLGGVICLKSIKNVGTKVIFTIKEITQQRNHEEDKGNIFEYF